MKRLFLFGISAVVAFAAVAAGQAKDSLPRPEHPRPQFVRDAWVNLNGKWTYEFDFGQSGTPKKRQGP